MSEVLDLIIDIKDPIIVGNTIKFEYQDPNCTPETYIRLKGEMNKYEFIAHCKQWAMNRGYQISACRHLLYKMIGGERVINYWVKSYIIKFDIGSFEPPYQIMNFDCNEESEVEAVIKACEWILKNDEPRLL